jgi:hypothetical protein
MHPLTQITIVTSATGSLSPSSPYRETPHGPTARKYRIEERRRTIYVMSDTTPTTEDLDKICGDIQERPLSAPANYRRQSLVETEREVHVVDEALTPPTSPLDHSIPATTKVSNIANVLRKTRRTSLRDSPRTPTRHRILFYHKNDPHYGFTNFSPHPVMYLGRKYPTSEHLFQSFKVCCSVLAHHCVLIGISSKATGRILQSIFGLVLNGRA